MGAVARIDPATCCVCSQVAFGHALEGWKLVFRPDAQGEMFALCPDCFGRLMPRLGRWMRDKRLLDWRAAAGGRLPRRARR
jgi:hypothetical protein